jgi:hypothetical protein
MSLRKLMIGVLFVGGEEVGKGWWDFDVAALEVDSLIDLWFDEVVQIVVAE